MQGIKLFEGFAISKPGCGFLTSRQEMVVLIALAILGIGCVVAGYYSSSQGYRVLGEILRYASGVFWGVWTILMIRKAIESYKNFQELKRIQTKTQPNTPPVKGPVIDHTSPTGIVQNKDKSFIERIVGKNIFHVTPLLHDLDPKENIFKLQAIQVYCNNNLKDCIYKGKFDTGRNFLLIKFAQFNKFKDEKINNFLLFIEPPITSEVHIAPTESKWKILFDLKNPKDEEALKEILAKGEGRLRRSKDTDWIIKLEPTAK